MKTNVERRTIMKEILKKRWIVPVATLVLTLSIGSAAFAATGSSSPDTTAATSASTGVTASASTDTGSAPAGATATNPWGNQRSDETPLTGDALAKVTAIAVDRAGSDATIVRVETDSDASQSGHGTYEAHVITASGVAETIYVDSNFNYVSTETQQAGGPGCGPHDQGAAPGTSFSSTDSTAGTSNN
jgi:hypothetical protein